mgnify:FL=1
MRFRKKETKTKRRTGQTAVLAAAAALSGMTLTGCSQPGGQKDEEVVIYSNADDEAVEAMKKTLDQNGYEGKYIFQTFGTSELGGNQTENGVFVCFAPYDDPEIAVAIVIEHATWGSNLATTGVDILNAYFTADETGSAVTGENQLLP